jgi:misacylated tRNA(Ala) deacylase
MSTEKLYLESIEAGYFQNFHATVVEATDTTVVLDRTLFYPLGGGQHWDTGTLNGPNGPLSVTEVRGRTNVEHTTGEGHQLIAGDEVKGSIDWEHRYAHMRMHTAQHLVSGLVYELFNGARTVGNQIHADRSRIDFNPISFDETMLNTMVEAVNLRIDEGLEVTDSVMTRGQINDIMPPERTNMDLLPASVKDLRVVQIGEQVDMCPCAGTHVSNLREIGHIQILGKKSKGKGTQRVSYNLHIPERVREPFVEEL